MLIAQITDTHIVPKGEEWKSLPERKILLPSFAVHKWTGTRSLLSEIIQVVEPEKRLLKKKLHQEDGGAVSFAKAASSQG